MLNRYQEDPRGRMTELEFMNEKIQVCDECLKASCWHGVHMCSEATTAGTTFIPRSELLECKYENECYIRNLSR